MAEDREHAPQPEWQEDDRLAALARYQILDTPSETDFDDIVRLAARFCNAPIALISLVDDHRQWFKAALGVGASETPRDIAFCAHAIQQNAIMIVPDATQDARFLSNPLVTGSPNIRFYAGAPLVSPDGLPLGTLCVLDVHPRDLSDDQRDSLATLARQVVTQLELRRLLVQQRTDEERHRLILASAIDYAIISIDFDGIVTSWNEGARRILGWTADAISGRSLEIIFTPEDRHGAVMEREIAAALATGRGEDERWHQREDGSRFWASGEIMPLSDDSGSPVGFIKILRDRSHERESELALVHSETRTRLALEAADLGAWEAIPSLSAIHGDDRARELLQLRGDGPVDYQTGFLERIHPADRAAVDAHIRSVLQSDGQQRIDIEYRIIAHETGIERWIHSRATVIKKPGERSRLVGTVRDISAEKAAESHRQLLSNELQHRVKNTLAVVQGIVSQSLKNVATPAEARDAINSRLITLGRAHDLLTRTSWLAAPISEIITGATAAHGIRDDRVAIGGPSMNLTARAALALSMVMHELCTNAIKYGALSNDTGVVIIRWAVVEASVDSSLIVTWDERGGPEVLVPKRKGFGSRLIETSISSDLGKTSLEFAPEGVRWRLDARLALVQEV